MLKKVSEHIKPLSTTDIQVYFTSDFQLYHLIEFILREIEPSELTLTTFSISEEFIRKLLLLKDEGLIRSLLMITDHRVAVKALRLSIFANNTAEKLFLGNNHAKVVLFSNENWRVSILASQNLTRGNRIESGCIIVSDIIYKNLIKSITHEQQKMINANEVFR